MSERNINFDNEINRVGTKCLKYDFAVQRGKPKEVLPLWVADMDFKTSSYIEDALVKQAQHAVYGYTEVDDAYFQSVQNWMKNHYDWEVEENWFHKTPGIVFAIANAVRAFTEKGDAVLIQQPVYYPFSEVVLDNDRVLISSDLIADEENYYHIDFKDFEEKIIKNKVKLFVLCNPHNPVGRVWDLEELSQLGEICKKHNVIVFSDEIHADFIWDKKHVTFSKAGEGFGDFSITATSPSKTFNIAGLQISNIFIPNQDLYAKFHKEYNASGFSQLNAAGIIAAQAAYDYGEEWYQAVKKYIEANLDFTVEYVEKNLPELKVRKPEGTYLVWIDFRKLGLTDQELEDLIIYKAGLWLDSGAIFGELGSGFQRINVACPRSTLKKALDRITAAIRNTDI